MSELFTDTVLNMMTATADPSQGRNLKRHIAARSEQSAATRRLSSRIRRL